MKVYVVTMCYDDYEPVIGVAPSMEVAKTFARKVLLEDVRPGVSPLGDIEEAEYPSWTALSIYYPYTESELYASLEKDEDEKEEKRELHWCRIETVDWII